MEKLYWITEYGKVLLTYGFFMFVWPSVVFHKYIGKKSRTVRFGFCVTVQVVLVNTVVLLLGVFHILNDWTVRIFFYGIFLWAVLRRVTISDAKKKQVRRLITGTYGLKLFISDNAKSAFHWGKCKAIAFWKRNRAYFLEYVLLCVVVIFGMIYFTYGVFENYSYGFGDMYTHHSWIYGLIEGKSFSAGVYPEAMHCFIYSLHTLFGVRVYSCMLFFAGIHAAVFFVAAYCLMKEIFHWRYSAIFVLTMFLTVDLLCVDEIFSMSRLQWTLPQEFGLYTQFLCALFLLRFLKREPLKKKIWRDENLFLFSMSLAASFAIHFYATIMAFFLCLSVAVFALRKIFCKKRFVSLVAAVLCGTIISATPMGLALAMGTPFQGSIGWAVNVINGTDTNEGRAQQAASSVQLETDSTVVQETATETVGNSGQGNNTAAPQKISLQKKLQAVAERCMAFGKSKWNLIYRYSYQTLYREVRAQWIIRFSIVAVLLWAAYRILCFFIGIKRDLSSGQKQYFDGYPPMILASFLFMVLYAAPFLGLPELIAGSRLCSTGQMLILAVIVMPIDMLFSLLYRIGFKYVMHLLSAVTVGGIYLASILLGFFHGYLYCELTRYNSAVMVTEKIIDDFPQNSYTIVSGTDELYQVIEYGRHEEMLTFLKSSMSTKYTLPTEHIFMYVEKKPLQYAQSHFFIGPDWLAQEKYSQYFTTYFSESPDINASEISKELAEEQIVEFKKKSQAYSNLQSRTILHSKMYAWCERFAKMYNSEMKIYYEDNNFICYQITQNPYRLYHLEEQ